MDFNDSVKTETVTPAADSEAGPSNGASLTAPNYTNGGSPPDSGEDEFSKYKQEKAGFYLKLRGRCIELVKEKGLFNSDIDYLDQLGSKAYFLYEKIMEATTKKEIRTINSDFKVWKDNLGYSHIDAFQKATAIRKKRQQKEEQEAELLKPKEVVFSAQCEDVFADMESQYSMWDGTLRNRGAWYKSPRPGVKRGATRVDDPVVLELKKRVKKVKGNKWRFSNSWSGGISFHRTRGSVDFIYHMLPPG